MRREGIAADFVSRVAGSPTGRAVYRVAPSGATLLELRLHAGLGARRLATIRRSGDAVLLMGAPLREVSVVAAARPLFWNPGLVLEEGQGRFPWPAADVLFVNRREWHTYRHHRGPSCPLTVVTHHGDGAALIADGEEVAFQRPAHRFEGLDVGAGDAFAAAFTHANLLGRPAAECLGFAGEVALRFLRERELR
jgi:sugar/nucleoside kinase (ribokinase family)